VLEISINQNLVHMKTKVNYFVIITFMYNQQRTTINQIRPDIVKRPQFYPSDVEKMEDIGPGWYDRKYCGELNSEQLLQFIRDCNFHSTCQTMGSLTMEHGWMDAIAFDADVDYGEGGINAYISPVLVNGEIDAAFEKLPEEQKKVVKERVGKELGKIFDWLENEAIDWGYDEELPEYCREFDVDLYQLQLAM
jgi:hypothetical protein